MLAWLLLLSVFLVVVVVFVAVVSTQPLACCANGVSKSTGSTFIPPAEDTPVNPFLRRCGSLNNKRAEQTRPSAPGEEGAGAAPPGGTCGVCYAAAGHAHVSNLGEIVNRFHTDPPEKKKNAASLSDFHTASLGGGLQKNKKTNIFLAPPP